MRMRLVNVPSYMVDKTDRGFWQFGENFYSSALFPITNVKQVGDDFIIANVSTADVELVAGLGLDVHIQKGRTWYAYNDPLWRG